MDHHEIRRKCLLPTTVHGKALASIYEVLETNWVTLLDNLGVIHDATLACNMVALYFSDRVAGT